jgi:hypothetical protein
MGRNGGLVHHRAFSYRFDRMTKTVSEHGPEHPNVIHALSTHAQVNTFQEAS